METDVHSPVFVANAGKVGGRDWNHFHFIHPPRPDYTTGRGCEQEEEIRVKTIIDKIVEKIMNIEIPTTDEEWENFPRTWKGKLALLIIQCVLAAATVLITVKVFL